MMVKIRYGRRAHQINGSSRLSIGPRKSQRVCVHSFTSEPIPIRRCKGIKEYYVSLIDVRHFFPPFIKEDLGKIATVHHRATDINPNCLSEQPT
jgi:hypothetical protein